MASDRPSYLANLIMCYWNMTILNFITRDDLVHNVCIDYTCLKRWLLSLNAKLHIATLHLSVCGVWV